MILKILSIKHHLSFIRPYRKDDYTSFGYVNREKINDKLIDISYNVKYKTSFFRKEENL